MGALLNLIIGIIIFVYIYHQKKRYSTPPFLPLLFYTGSVVLGIAALFLSKYWDLNLPETALFSSTEVAENILILSLYAIFVGATYSVISLSFYLRGTPLPVLLKQGGIGFIVLIVLAYLLSTLAPRASLAYLVADFLLENAGILCILFELFYLARLFRISVKAENREKRKIGLTFSALFMGRYIVLPALILLPSLIRAFFALLYFHGSSLAWLKYFYLPHLERERDRQLNRGILDHLKNKFKLSEREEEILGLILSGKNNPEIEAQLFISYNTVKNHIYSIYKKIGVKNRYQLFKMMENLR